MRSFARLPEYLPNRQHAHEALHKLDQPRPGTSEGMYVGALPATMVKWKELEIGRGARQFTEQAATLWSKASSAKERQVLHFPSREPQR